jgi:hypothetical protein
VLLHNTAHRMQEAATVVEETPVVKQAAVVVPIDAVDVGIGDPPPPFTSWCDWARDGLRQALEGMKQSGGGVTEYHVGSRGLKREGLKSQIDNVAYWNAMVKLYCGVDGLPSAVTGRDTACRIVPRDL